MRRVLGSGCVDGSACVTNGGEEICAPHRELGEDCKGQFQCPMQATCSDGICQQFLVVGAACDSGVGALRHCGEGSQCVDGTCQRLPSRAKRAAMCA